jgi:hypothetical protein
MKRDNSINISPDSTAMRTMADASPDFSYT